MDFALVVLTLVAFIIAAVTLDQPSQFTDNNGDIVYYTLPSFWQTYSHTVRRTYYVFLVFHSSAYAI